MSEAEIDVMFSEMEREIAELKAIIKSMEEEIKKLKDNG